MTETTARRRFYREKGRPIDAPVFWADCSGYADGCTEQIGPFSSLAAAQATGYCDACGEGFARRIRAMQGVR